jgi:hypothetical protein
LVALRLPVNKPATAPVIRVVPKIINAARSPGASVPKGHWLPIKPARLYWEFLKTMIVIEKNAAGLFN